VAEGQFFFFASVLPNSTPDAKVIEEMWARRQGSTLDKAVANDVQTKLFSYGYRFWFKLKFVLRLFPRRDQLIEQEARDVFYLVGSDLIQQRPAFG